MLTALRRICTVFAQWVFEKDLHFRSDTRYLGKLEHANTADRAYTLPDKDGTVAMISDVSASATTIADTASVNLTLAGSQVSADVIPAGVDHNSLANLTTGDPHTQYLPKAGGALTGNVTADAGVLVDGVDVGSHTHSGAAGMGPNIAYTSVTGLGTLATQSGTFSGTSSGTNTGDQTLGSLGAMADAQPCARVYKSSNQSIADVTEESLIFDGAERFDTDAIHDLATNPSRLTCKTAGKYAIWAHLSIAYNATGYRYAFIRLNGTTYIAGCSQGLVPGNPIDISLTTLYDLAVNDYVEVRVYQNSGGALNVTANGNYSPEFGMVRVSS